MPQGANARVSAVLPLRPRSPLRDLTRAEHAEVDELFSLFDISKDAGYRAFLSALSSAHLSIEAALDAAGAASIVDDWSARRRGHLVRADLADLGLEAGHPAGPPPLRTDAEMLGAIYVLEGSRLGGAVLATRLANGAPARFLTAPSRPGAWRDLLMLLNDRLEGSAERDVAAGTARACFRCFAEAASLELEPRVA